MNSAKRKWLLLTIDLALFGGVVIIGYLQSRRVNAGFWTNYGADLIGPVWLYSGLRQLKIWKGRYPTAELAAGGCFRWLFYVGVVPEV